MTAAATSTPRPPALAHEVSCRFLTPLLDLAETTGRTAGLAQILSRWSLARADLRDESNWISLRFCEELVDWLGGEIGPEVLAEKVTRAPAGTGGPGDGRGRG
jgi:hypothetical protein